MSKWTSPIPPLTNPETFNLALRARVHQHQIDIGGGVGLGARWGPGHRSPIITTTTRVRTHEGQPWSHWATSCYRGNSYHPPTFSPLLCLLLLLTASSSSVSPPMRRRFAGLCPPSCSFSSITETHSEVGLTKHFPHSLSLLYAPSLSLPLSLFLSAAEIIQSAELSLLDSFRRYVSLPEGEFPHSFFSLWDFIHFNSVFHSFRSL